MEVVDRINNQYKETPAQGKIHSQVSSMNLTLQP